MLHPGKGRRIFPICYEAILESTKVTSIVCDKAMEKMEKCLNLWIHEMAISFFCKQKHSSDVESQTIL